MNNLFEETTIERDSLREDELKRTKIFIGEVTDMNELCPISDRGQVDERVAQMNAALAVLSLLFFFFTPYRWIVLVLTADYFIRAFLDPSYSFYSAASRAVLGIIKVRPSMINAGPKIFAAKIGVAFCCMISLCYFLGFRTASLVVGAIFAACAALEASFRFCIACKIYPFIYGEKKFRFLTDRSS